MSLTENLLRNFINFYPQISKIATSIQRKHNLIVNYPIVLKPTSSNHSIYSEQKIKKGNDILLLSVE